MNSAKTQLRYRRASRETAAETVNDIESDSSALPQQPMRQSPLEPLSSGDFKRRRDPASDPSIAWRAITLTSDAVVLTIAAPFIAVWYVVRALKRLIG